MNKEFWMEDVRHLSVISTNLIQEELKKFNIKLTAEQEDELFVPIWNFLEGLSNGDYRSQN